MRDVILCMTSRPENRDPKEQRLEALFVVIALNAVGCVPVYIAKDWIASQLVLHTCLANVLLSLAAPSLQACILRKSILAVVVLFARIYVIHAINTHVKRSQVWNYRRKEVYWHLATLVSVHIFILYTSPEAWNVAK